MLVKKLNRAIIAELNELCLPVIDGNSHLVGKLLIQPNMIDEFKQGMIVFSLYTSTLIDKIVAIGL
jgi:hypothetical protein